MSLVLHLRSIENLKNRGDRVAKATFRGVAQFSKNCESCDSFVFFDEVFRWNLPQAIEASEQIEIQIFNHKKYLANRLIGSFGMVLQQLIEVGRISVSDCLLDDNNVVTQATINFDLTYNAPDPRLTQLITTSMEVQKTSDTKPLISPSSSSSSRGMKGATSASATVVGHDAPLLRHQETSLSQVQQGKVFEDAHGDGKIRSMRTIGKMIRFVKRTKRMAASHASQVQGRVNPEMERASCSGDSEAVASGDENQDDSVWNESFKRSLIHLETTTVDSHGMNKAEDYQVSITIIEARQLSGVNMNPVVCVQVGEHKKYTSVKESTNCPYYNEYFVFDFNIIPSVLFDKIITISVLHSRNFLRSGTKIGSMKIDVGTVYNAPDHHFYHKWAVLTDPDDIAGGPKGYVKCDIAVFGKGDKIRVPQKKTDADEDDIESNLLVPDGSPSERQRAKFIVTCHKAEGLPRMSSGIVANVKKALTGESKDLVDPYCLVTFAGHQGRTSVKKGRYNPVWNEEIIFTEMFPPFCRRVKVQVRDDSVNDEVIATHFIDLSTISNDGENGFLPTFGPSWVNLYGSTRSYSILEEYPYLNEGIAPGIHYRGRILLALRTEIVEVMSESNNSYPPVDVAVSLPVSEGALGAKEEFHLFGAIFESTMIDRRFSDKPVQFEMSIGIHGNILDGKYDQPSSPKKPKEPETTLKPSEDESPKPSEVKSHDESQTDGEDGDESKPLLATGSSDGGCSRQCSVSSPMLPMTTDKYYYFLPYDSTKPFLWTSGSFEDHRIRCHNSNLLYKMSEQLERDLEEIHGLIKLDKGNPDKKLKLTLENLSNACSRYLTLTSTRVMAKGAKTKLDKERLKHCRAEVEAIGSCVRILRPHLNSSNVKDKVKLGHDLLMRLKKIRSDPQHGIPDVFIWMIQNRKRVAYQRIPSRDLLFSTIDEEKGKYCGKMQTLMLRMPTKKGAGGWNLQARLKMYLWLGSAKQRKSTLIGLPQGYQVTPFFKNISNTSSAPPTYLKYTESHSYQLRAHMYQARGLIGSDDSGLSDPFARVVVGKQSLLTRVIEQTLNPSWDEMLIFREVIVHSSLEAVRDCPPEVVVEIFDRDRMGKSEFIGRAIAHPVVKGSKEKYEAPLFPPKLEWHVVWRGDVKAGELLAAFELLQLAPQGESSCNDLPPCELPEIADQSRSSMPVPKGIRPILSTYRIEILFWGVRDLKRIQFLHVEKPRIDVECSGRVIMSSVIKNCRKNPNFLVPVKYMDVELPNNDLYCPPITIRCVDCRNFGRFVLAGNHVIDNIRRFLFVPSLNINKQEIAKKLIENFEFSQQSVLPLPHRSSTFTPTSKATNDVVVVLEDEKIPLITKHESIVTIETGKPTASNADLKKQKQPKEASKRRRSSLVEEEEMAPEGLDWWTKYHASLLCQESEPASDHANRKYSRAAQSGGGTQNHDQLPNGKPGDPRGDATNDVVKAASTVEPMAASNAAAVATAGGKYDVDSKGKLSSLKFSRAATSLVAKLSPKSQRRKDKKYANWAKLKVYSGELEAEFGHFKEWLHTFDLYRGKRTYEIADDDSRVVGKFKGAIVIYKLPLPTDIGEGLLDIGGNLKIYRSLATTEGKNDDLSNQSCLGGTNDEGPPINSLFQGLPSNEPLHILVRVYIVKGIDLHPADLNGKADPYIVIKLGQTTINDKENYISKQLNPVFGKCFEVEATFPQDSLLRVQVFDWDLIGTDDVIGETIIDLENRFFSRHRATCGLALQYDTDGYNAWRDPMKPTQILAKLCKDYRLDGPYYQPGRVRIGSRVFNIPAEADTGKSSDEHLALAVLHHWEEMPKVGCKLVTEHVETRPLFHPEKPGMEQGKLEMWIDMFPIDMPAPGPPVDISPRKPKSYELRVIIWNTDDVVLEDDAFFTGEKMSDIYVKGWLKGQEDMQSTDIHYRSLTGEGNFNWRFIFPFEYLVAEEKVVISRKDNVFSWDETETKIPARLSLQVWDADHFSADDFLGAMTFDLTQFPRGAKSSKQCTLDMLKTDGSVPQMNLFKHKRVKGWWPFYVKVSGEEMELTGKVEAELHLLTAEEAEKHPTGQGRNEPDPLEKPNRPDTSFVWFLNPIKSLRYILWHNYRWLFLKVLLFLLLGLLLALFFYSLPGYTVKKMLGA